MVIGRVVAIIVAIIFDQLRKQRRPRVSQSVNTGRRWRGKYCFASRGDQIIVEKCHARFIKKISQLKSDIRSCRCKNFSLKVVSVRSDMGVRIPRTLPLDPPLYVLPVKRKLRCSSILRKEKGTQKLCEPFQSWNLNR